LDLGAQRYHRRPQAGRAHEVCRSAVAEDGVKLVLAIRDQRIAVLGLAEQPVAAAKIPAARALAKVAANRAHIADLRAGNSTGGLGQGREALVHHSALEQLVDSDGRSDAESVLGILNPAQLLDVFDI